MISVLMPTYNGEEFLEKQINSILNCLGDQDELIIADDSSTDSTVEILSRFSDSRIKVIYRVKNIGLIKSIEQLILASNGDYIFLSDQDDVWLPNRIKSIFPFFEKYDLIVSDCVVTNESLEILSESYFKNLHPKSSLLSNLISCRYLGCCMAMKKVVALSILPFPKNVPAHDLWIGVLARLMGFAIYFSYDPVILYRRHVRTSSLAGSLKRRKFPIVLLDRLNLIVALIKYIHKIIYIRYQSR